MPVIREAILAGILAHRGDADPVPKKDVANLKGRKQMRESVNVH
jgi:hypothetical protein